MWLPNHFLIGHRHTLIMAVVMLFLEAGTTAATKYPLKYLVDYLLGAAHGLQADYGLPVLISSHIDTIAVLTAAIILIALSNSVSDSLAEIYLAQGGRLLGVNLRTALHSHLQKLSLAFYNQRRTGDLLTHITADVTALEDFTIKSLKDIAGSVFTLAVTLGVLVWSSWQVALAAFVMMLPLALVSDYFSERIKVAVKKQRAYEGDLASAAQEMLTSIRVIQTFSRGGYEQQRFAEQSQKTMDAALKTARFQAWFSGVITVLQGVSIALIIWTGVWLIDRQSITVGALVFFIWLIQDMFKPTKRIIREWNSVGKVFASAERISDLLECQPAVRDEPGAIEASPFKGQIEYRNVSFAYQRGADDPSLVRAADARPSLALNDLNTSMAPGEVVALVGSSGAGKSTIVQLLPRLYDPHSGQVLIDGHDIREFTLDSLRSQISMVLQDTILFTGSVADNIAYGCPGATRELIIAAAMHANAHEFIQKLPNGYDSILSERAANLSGGQRQRIAIARAFIRNTPLLILDEPTTGLDAESTDLVLEALQTLMKGKTTIIISHDFNLIRDADKILVVEAGRIAQAGTHDSLLKAGGLYANLYRKQFGPAEAIEVTSPSEPAGEQPSDELEMMTPLAFQTLMMQALPQPVDAQAFRTLVMPPAQLPAGQADQPSAPLAEHRSPAPGTQALPRAAQRSSRRTAIFQTIMMHVITQPLSPDTQDPHGRTVAEDDTRAHTAIPQETVRERR
jgi:ABC-type multidrug transport system fused ATPase/permease subunit